MTESSEYIKINKNQHLPSSDIYEADDEDLKFIEAFNRKQASALRLAHNTFEKIMEICEQNSLKEVPVMFYEIKNKL